MIVEREFEIDLMESGREASNKNIKESRVIVTEKVGKKQDGTEKQKRSDRGDGL